MQKHLFVVYTNAKDGRDDEFNEWYDNRHIPDVLKVPGVVSAKRYVLSGFQRPTPHPYKYMAIYEIETDDLEAVSNEIARRVGTPVMPRSDALSLDVETHFYRPWESARS